jgi:hypothetical protein
MSTANGTVVSGGFFRLTARYFLLLAQKKVPKEKGPPCPGRLRRLPCAARNAQRLRNSPSSRAQTVLAETLGVAPLLGGASRAPEKTPPQNRHRSQYSSFQRRLERYIDKYLTVFSYKGWVPFPVGDAEKRRQRWGFGEDCLRERSDRVPQPPALTSIAGKFRRFAPKPSPPGSPFLWLLSFGEAKESSSPAGETAATESRTWPA